MPGNIAQYTDLLGQIKKRIRQGQTRAVLAANSEMICMYWDIGRMLHKRQQQEGWGASVIPRLSRDLRNELPEMKGFSERNIKLMVQFHREYPTLFPIGQRAVAQLPASAPSPADQGRAELMQRLVAQLLWGTNVLLIQRIKDIATRCWYAQAVIEHGWSRDVLNQMIDNHAHERQGKAVSNFGERLPPAHSDMVQQALKDPYI